MTQFLFFMLFCLIGTMLGRIAIDLVPQVIKRIKYSRMPKGSFPLPGSVKISQNQRIPVLQEILADGLGSHTDFKTLTIYIDSRLPEIEKSNRLLRELVNITNVRVGQNYPKDIKYDDFISAFSGLLFPMLTLSGLWSGIMPNEMQQYLDWLSVQKAPNRATKRRSQKKAGKINVEFGDGEKVVVENNE